MATGVPYALPTAAGEDCENVAVEEGNGVEMVANGEVITGPALSTDMVKGGFKSIHASSNCIRVGKSGGFP